MKKFSVGQNKLFQFFYVSICLHLLVCLSFAETGISNNFTVSKDNYRANSLNVNLDLSKSVSINPGFSVYYSSYSANRTKSYSINTGVKTGERSYLDFDFLFYPEVENYKSNMFGIGYSDRIKNTKLKIGYSNTKHSQYIYRPIKKVWEWFDLRQRAFNSGIAQRHKKANISISYTGYGYDKDIEKLSEILDYFSLKNTSLSGASSLINGFPKSSVSFGFGYDISKFFSTSFNYSSINYKLEQPKSKSYLFNLTFYPKESWEILTEYNNFDIINYWTVGVGYYWR